MRRWKLTCVAIGVMCTAFSAVVTGCGDDDQGVIPTDGGKADVVVTPIPDTGTPDTSRPDSGGDGGDAGPCDFADFVKNLIATQTTATSVPSADLGESCADKQDQAQFAPLFP